MDNNTGLRGIISFIASLFSNSRSFEEDERVPADYTPEYVAKCKKFAEAGNPIAQLRYAKAFTGHGGVETDHAEAVKWLRKAAENGIAEAQHKLVWIYRHNPKYGGLPKYKNIDEKWIRKVAEQGDYASRELLEYWEKKKKEEDEDSFGFSF